MRPRSAFPELEPAAAALLRATGLDSRYQSDQAGWIAFIYRNMLDFVRRDGAGSVGGLGVDGRDGVPVYRDGRRCAPGSNWMLIPLGCSAINCS